MTLILESPHFIEALTFVQLVGLCLGFGAKWHILARDAGLHEKKLDRLVSELTDAQRDEAKNRATAWQQKHGKKTAQNTN